MKTTEQVRKKVNQFRNAYNFFQELMKEDEHPRFSEDECPFMKNGEQEHYILSAACNAGNWRWECPLCGKHDEE